MKYDRDIHNRRSIRLPGYDYAQEGAYFITLCTHNRECIFGEIANQTMQSNQLGKIIVREWTKTPQIRPNVSLDGFILMPNHFHAIAFIDVRAYRDVSQK